MMLCSQGRHSAVQIADCISMAVTGQKPHNDLAKQQAKKCRRALSHLEGIWPRPRLRQQWLQAGRHAISLAAKTGNGAEVMY